MVKTGDRVIEISPWSEDVEVVGDVHEKTCEIYATGEKPSRLYRRYPINKLVAYTDENQYTLERLKGLRAEIAPALKEIERLRFLLIKQQGAVE